MAYAQLKDWPDGYEEVEYLAKKLKHTDPTYSVQVERTMFALHGGGEYVIAIIRWEGSKYQGTLKRTLLATYEDISEATGMLRLLIGNAEAERDELNRRG
jgi:hypothetical protein